MFSQSNIVNTLSLKIGLNIESLQINGYSIYIDNIHLTDQIKETIFDLGFTKIFIVDIDFKVILYQKPTTRKRVRESENFFNKENWVSPSRVKNFFNDSFEGLLKENPDIMMVKELPLTNIFFEKGNEFEKFIYKKLEEKYPITTICKNTFTPDPIKFKETLSMMYCGFPIIYQGLLLDGSNKTFGCPDFIIRSDILKKIFPKMKFNFTLTKSKIGQYYYSVVDVKFKTLEFIKNDFEISASKKYQASIAQVVMYQDIINKIQGKFDYCYLLGKRGLKKSKNLKFNGLECLGEINLLDEKIKRIKYESGIYIEEIKYLRKYPNRYLLDNLPERYQPDLTFINTQFPLNKKYFKDKYLKEEIKNNFNFENSDKIVSEIPSDRLVIYLDFETIDTDLIFTMDKILTNFNSTFLSQIGIYIPQTDEYHSFVSVEPTYSAEYTNLYKFIDYIKNQENKFNQKVVFVAYGNYERNLYNKIGTYYDIPDFEFIDILKIFKSYKLKTSGSYSLKIIAKELAYFYKNFTLTYNNSNIKNGMDAMYQIIDYYKNTTNVTSLQEAEYYNELDCRMMYEIINFLKNFKQI